MTVLERRMFTIALVLGILTAGIAAGKTLHGSAWQAPVARANSGTYYGANDSFVYAGAWQWPQKQNNWCAVANIEVIANYTYQLAGGIHDTPFMSGGQQRIASDLNSSAAVSEWGTPSPNGIGPGFKADIARDGGTDPRSIAWGIEYESSVGSYWRYLHSGSKVLPPIEPTIAFHDVILHGNANQSVSS
ncbi:MAG: hypothetical protein ACRDHP_09990, partial [Ktedonobacterales bacterium]